MKRSEFKSQLDQLLRADVEGLSWDGKLALLKQRIVTAEKQREFDKGNKGEPWTDLHSRVLPS